MPKIPRRTVLASLAASVALALPAIAQPVPSPSAPVDPQDFLKNAIRIDGSKLKTTVKVVAELPAPDPGDGDSANLAPPTANVVMDAWTRRALTTPVGEDYDFAVGEEITFTVFAKIGETGAGGTGGEGLDLVVFPCGSPPMPPLARPIVLIDDIIFTPIAPGTVRLITLSVAITGLSDVFPAGSRVDWFAAVDFDATNNPDTDGDTFADVALETGPPRFVDVTLSTVDEVGATVISFFNPGPGLINVFGPHPPNPAVKAIGTGAGEDGETRPWCFGIN